MKKIISTCIALFFCITTFAQTLTTTSTTLNSGDTFTLTGVGETLSHYFLAEQSQSVWTVANPAYTTNQSIQFVNVSYYNTVSHTPTSLQFKVFNTAPVPVQVTYRIVVMPYDGVNFTSLPPVNTDITLTVNPAPQPTGIYAKLVSSLTGTVIGPNTIIDADYNVWVRFYSDPQGQNEITNILPSAIPVVWSHDSNGRQGPQTTITTTTVNHATVLSSQPIFTQPGGGLNAEPPYAFHLLPSGNNYTIINWY